MASTVSAELPRPRVGRSVSGCAQRCACIEMRAPGESSTSTRPCPFTWMAACGPPLTSSPRPTHRDTRTDGLSWAFGLQVFGSRRFRARRKGEEKRYAQNKLLGRCGSGPGGVCHEFAVLHSPLLLGNVWRAVDPGPTAGTTPSIGKVVGESVWTLVITYVLARLIALLGGSDWKAAVRLALWLWFGFSAMMWVGAIYVGEDPMANRRHPFR